MKKILLSITLLCVGTANAAPKAQNVVYGDDDRVDVYETSATIQKIAKSTAGMIPSNNIIKLGKDHSMLPPINLNTSMNVCAAERFANQSNAMTCSGFLVGPDLLVTAGHCVRSEDACAEVSFVFDYAVEKETKKERVAISNSKVYTCKAILESKLEVDPKDPSLKRDFALIRLDRPVTDREYLKFRTNNKIKTDQELYMIGHPSGLPQKYADGAKVMLNDNPHYFVANLDAFGGNSGSAVFNQTTNEVEGILVRGETDYRNKNGCNAVNYESNSYPIDNSGKHRDFGEQVNRITDISTLVNRAAYLEAIKAGNVKEFKRLYDLVEYKNIHDDELNSALMLAIIGNHTEIVQVLAGDIGFLSDRNLKGETLLDLFNKSNDSIKNILSSKLAL